MVLVASVALLAVGANAEPGVRAPAATFRFAPEAGRFYLTHAEVALMRRNAARKPWARLAWMNVKAAAAEALATAPTPAPGNGDYTRDGTGVCGDGDDGWRDCLYAPGLVDGQRARNLALAYAMTGTRRYAFKSKEFLLAWARSYDPVASNPGHSVAEPVGFMIKGFMAYDLVQDVFTPSERQLFKRWAATFVSRGKKLTDAANDEPWSPAAPYGNGATWPRALAVTASAVVGGRTLRSTLAWNWQHRTAKGASYGWLDLLEGAMGSSGQMTEEPVRQSIAYGLYTWGSMALIADVAAHAGAKENLWTAKTKGGKSMYLPVLAYAGYLREKKLTPYAEERDTSYSAKLGEYRAVMELAHKAYPGSKVAREIVQFGGPRTRGTNYDPHISGWNALTGR